MELVDAYDFATFLNEVRNYGYASKDPNNRNENDPNSVRITKGLNGRTIDGRELYLDVLTPYLNKQPGLINTNWMDEGFRKAEMQNYDISFSGGGKTKYYASLGYFNQKGVVLGTDLKRYSVAIKLQTKLSDRIKIGLNLKPPYQK